MSLCEACATSHLPGVLFPCEDGTQIQRCDECSIYEDNGEAAQALEKHLNAAAKDGVRYIAVDIGEYTWQLWTAKPISQTAARKISKILYSK